MLKDCQETDRGEIGNRQGTDEDRQGQMGMQGTDRGQKDTDEDRLEQMGAAGDRMRQGGARQRMDKVGTTQADGSDRGTTG